MSRSSPSLLALLGLVAVAGYQNRNKISEVLNGVTANPSTGGASQGGGFLSEIGNMFQSGTAGGTISGGLGDLINRFKNAGHGPTADSWIGTGSNAPIQSNDLESALGHDTLTELEQKTGLSRSELLQRLSTSLPDMVNQLTPDGHVPTASEAGRFRNS